jgi:hypothetical protein
VDTKLIERLLSAIDDVVSEGTPWREKHDAIVSECSPDQQTNLSEFLTWFEGDESDDEDDDIKDEKSENKEEKNNDKH